MQIVSDQRIFEAPEKLISGLVARLRNHALWDSLLIFFPPFLVSIYSLTYLYRAAWITQMTFLFLSAAAVGISVIAVVMHCRPLIPSVRAVAGLVDERVGAKDRFITLATIEPASCSPLLFSRVRREAAGFLDRIEIESEFPYKLKHSFFWSAVNSIVALLFFLWLLPVVQSSIHPVPASSRILELAQKMAQRPRLEELARDLQTLAMKIEDPKLSRQEKQILVEETQEKVEEQQKKQQQKDDRDLLDQASSALKGLERQSGNGQDDRKDQGQAGGSIQSNLPHEGQGDSKQNQGSDGDSKGELKAQLSKEMQQGKSAQGDPKEQGNQTNQQTKGEGKSKGPDKADGDKNRETAGKKPGRSEETGGKDKASEEIPKGATPTDRFYQPGEQGKGKEGIKGARYVTVQLPEEAGADSKGMATTGRESKLGRNPPKAPVSNVPLPDHVPDAPTEKQQMPLEYRGLIR